MIEYELAFSFLWNKFKCRGINLSPDFMIRGKKWVLKLQQLRTAGLHRVHFQEIKSFKPALIESPFKQVGLVRMKQ